MAFSHSFTPEFYGSCYESEKKDRPTNVCDALRSMSDREWALACKAVGLDPEYTDIADMLSIVIETDTVGTLSVPVDVWIDPEGYHTVDVYE